MLSSLPSVTHSSRPWTPSSAMKYARLPVAMKSRGRLPSTPARISLTFCVVVPFVRHGSAALLGPVVCA